MRKRAFDDLAADAGEEWPPGRHEAWLVENLAKGDGFMKPNNRIAKILFAGLACLTLTLTTSLAPQAPAGAPRGETGYAARHPYI